MSAAIYESKYIFNSPNQSNDRRASGFGVITSFETALSPVNSDTSSKLCKPELLSQRSEYVQNKLSVISENPAAMSRVGRVNQTSMYWHDKKILEKKNTKMVGKTEPTPVVVANLGSMHKEIYKPVTERKVRGDENPEHN